MTDKTTNKAPASPRETIIIMQPDAGLRASNGRFETITAEPVSDLEKMLKKYNATMVPMFGSTEERVEQEMMTEAAEGDIAMPELDRFYMLKVEDEKAEEAAEAMAKLGQVETAYVKPGAEPPVMMDEEQDIEAPTPDDAPPVTGDLRPRQNYLNPSPVGVNAQWAWARAGGRGQNVRIIDIEGAWRFSHEDLLQMQGGVVGGTQSTDLSWRNHGTAVLGVYSGDHNSYGISGICDQAIVSAVSIFGGMGSANAIRHATRRLRSGDVLLLELHRPGPRHNFQSRDDQKGYIAIEWWEDDYAAILAATRRGIIVVEAAGNGAENLDDAIYQVRPANFPNSWSNSFRRSNRDSGAIVVGAGAPPPGTHGRNHGPDRSRLEFSNYGALVDAQGWGREVTTCGYGDLQGGHEDVWYTDRFSGTSSASPIVVGAIASLQGMVRARGAAVLTPAKVRQCLRTTGATQTAAPGRPQTQRIGNRPDLVALYRCALGPVKNLGKEIIKEGKEIIKEAKEKDIKDIKDRIKDGKDKDRIKDVKEKDIKDRIKDIKEKDIKDHIKNKDNEAFGNKPTSQSDGLEYQSGANELNEQTLQEMEAKNFKEFKEGKEIKEVKEKDRKEFKEFKEGKDFKEKDRKEFKEFKEGKDFKEKDRKDFKEKDRKEFKERDGKLLENQQFENWDKDRLMPQTDDLGNRLASLETMVSDLTHFIASELRPDLIQGAQDYADEGQQDDNDPEIAAQIAKDEKDVKDNETF